MSLYKACTDVTIAIGNQKPRQNQQTVDQSWMTTKWARKFKQISVKQTLSEGEQGRLKLSQLGTSLPTSNIIVHTKPYYLALAYYLAVSFLQGFGNVNRHHSVQWSVHR